MLSLVACVPTGLQGEQGPQGETGAQGNDGLSAYEIFKKHYPDYTGTEEQWIYDVATNNICGLFGHKKVIDAAIEATCTENGLTQGSHCQVCEKVLVEQEVVKANHNYVDGKCSKCNIGYESETVWLSMLDIENFDNFTFYMYAESPNGDTSTQEMLIKIDGDTMFMNGIASTDPEVVAVYMTPLLQIVLASLENYDNFTYDGVNNTYKSNTQIVYTLLNVWGKDVTFTNDNVVVALDANNHLASMSCNMKQEFEGIELNVVVTFEFTDYGTTKIETNSDQKDNPVQKTYDEVVLILEDAFANGKEQNYWSVTTYTGENVVSEYNKDNSPSQEFTDAIFDIRHDRLVVAQILSNCTQSNFILTTTDGQITITTTDCPDEVEMLTFVIEDELIKSYSMYANGNEFKTIFTYENKQF